jgi:NAD(P)-dependent dehydrogenase (short-subunit alcohol dehydrogenase family)
LVLSISSKQIGWGYTVADTINTNYFGPRRVNDAFGHLLQRPGGRIVNVASASGPNFLQGLTASDEALKEKLYRPWTLLEGGTGELDKMARAPWPSDNGYGISKALVNAYTALHAKAEPDLVINSVTPGWIQTDLTKGMGATNPPAKGAIPVCTLLMDEAFANPTLHPTGRYYGSDMVRSPMHYYRGPGEAPYVNDDDLL